MTGLADVSTVPLIQTKLEGWKVNPGISQEYFSQMQDMRSNVQGEQDKPGRIPVHPMRTHRRRRPKRKHKHLSRRTFGDSLWSGNVGFHSETGTPNTKASNGISWRIPSL